MEAQDFKEVTVRIAEKQPEYQTLPAHYNENEGSLTFCFELNEKEIEQVQKTGKIWIKQITFGGDMNPIAPSCLKEDLLSK